MHSGGSGGRVQAYDFEHGNIRSYLDSDDGGCDSDSNFLSDDTSVASKMNYTNVIVILEK